MALAPDYTVPTLEESYLSDYLRADTAFDGNVMKYTDKFLDNVLQEDILPPGVADELDFDDLDPFLDALVDDLGDVMSNNWRILTAIIFGIMVAFTLPIVGCLWCCYCKKSGARKATKKSDKTIFYVQCATMFVFFILSLLVMLWYIASDVWIGVKIGDLGAAYNAAKFDTNTYINNTVLQVDHLTEQNYAQLEGAIDQSVQAGITRFDDYVQTNLVGDAGDVDLQGLSDVVAAANGAVDLYQGGPLIEGSQENVENTLADYRTGGLALESPVNDLQGSAALTQLIFAAASAGYDTAGITNLRSNLLVDTAALPSPAMASLPELNLDIRTEAELEGLEIEINDAIQLATDFPTTYGNEISNTITDELDAVGEDINSTTSEIVSQVGKLTFDYDPQDGDDLDDDVDKWDDLALIILAIPWAVVFVVFVLYAIGIGMGAGGRVGTNTRRRGTKFLNAGTITLFVMALIVWSMCVIFFFMGSVGQKLGCYTLEAPEDSELYDALEDAINEEIKEELNDTRFDDTTWSVPVILDLCENNTGIFTALKLYEVYGDDLQELENWQQTSNIDQLIQDSEDEVVDILDQIVRGLNLEPAEEDAIADLTAAVQPVEVAVDAAANSVDPTAVFDGDNYDAFKAEFQQMVDTVGTLDVGLIQQVENEEAAVDQAESVFDQSASDAQGSLQALSQALQVDGGSLSDAIATVPQDVSDAQDYLDGDSDCSAPLASCGQGRSDILGILNSVSSEMIALGDDYVDYALALVYDDLGRCRPVYNVYWGAVNMLCYKVLDPFNWTWAGMGLLLLLLLPMQAVAMWMADTLSHHPEGGYVEPKKKKQKRARTPWGRKRQQQKEMEEEQQQQQQQQHTILPAAVAAENGGLQHQSSARNPVFSQEPEHAAVNGDAKPYDPAEYYPGYAGATAVTAAAIADKHQEKKRLYEEEEDDKKGPYNPAAFAPEYGGPEGEKKAAEGGAYNPGDFSPEYGTGSNNSAKEKEALATAGDAAEESFKGLYDPSEYHPSYAARDGDKYELPDVYKGDDGGKKQNGVYPYLD